MKLEKLAYDIYVENANRNPYIIDVVTYDTFLKFKSNPYIQQYIKDAEKLMRKHKIEKLKQKWQ